jgi:hypothetical protein
MALTMAWLILGLDERGAMAVVHGLEPQPGGQAGLAHTGSADQDDVAMLVDEPTGEQVLDDRRGERAHALYALFIGVRCAVTVPLTPDISSDLL